MPYNGGVANVRQTPTVGQGTTAQRVVSIRGSLWLNLDSPDNPVWQYFDGTDWINVNDAPAIQAWLQGGNSWNADGVLGTNDNFPLYVRAAALNFMRIDTDGNVLLNKNANDAARAYSNSWVFNGSVPILQLYDRHDNYPYQKMLNIVNDNTSASAGLRRLGISFNLADITGSAEVRKGAAITYESSDAFSDNGQFQFWAGNQSTNPVVVFFAVPTRLEVLKELRLNVAAAGSVGPVMQLRNANIVAGTSADIDFQTDANICKIRFVRTAETGAPSQIEFWTRLNDAEQILRKAYIAPNGALYVGMGTLNASAAMQVDSETGGFLPPKMTTTQRDAIATPTSGLVIYNTSTNKHQGYDGSTWNDFY